MSPAASPAALAALDVDAHLDDPARKQAFVTPMFDVIAPRYDAFTRRFSLGMDAGWKREAVRRAVRAVDALPAPRVLDVASGTGDLANAVARALPAARVLGVDASRAMSAAAATRLADLARDGDVAGRVRVATGDLARLPLRDASVDLVLGGYAVRNAPSLDGALAELARVLAPGGALVTLDFHRPPFAPWRAAWLAYLRVAGDTVGWWWHRTPVVYGYIARSIARFVSVETYAARLEAHGFAVESTRRWMGGGIGLVVARRTPP